MQNNRQKTRAFGIDNHLAWLASLAVVGWASLALAADVGKPNDAKAGDTINAAGILTTDGNVNSLMVLTDGEEAPAKYEFGGGFDKQTLKGIFSVSRVQLAYVRDGDIRKLLKIKKETPVATGTVTGSVVLLGNNAFWIAVKTKDGHIDGYADSWPPGKVNATLKTLHKGDTVRIKYHTDFERHRIDALEVLPTPAQANGPNAAAPGQAAKLPEGVQALRDVEYAKVGATSLLLDIFKPSMATGKLPLVIWVHGGAWSAGNKEWQPIPALPMTARGYAVATIDYRLSGEAKWPAQIHDCKAAVRFLRAHAKEYNLDPDRFGVWGSSAGGHLVAMLGTSGDVRELEGDLGNPGVSSRVQAVCDWFGPTDLLVLDNANPVKGLLGGPASENVDKAKQANPITWISKDAPPFLIMHGDQDKAVSIKQSELLREALRKAGGWVKFVAIPGVGHDFRGPEGAAAVPWAILKPEYLKTVNEFFDEKLKGKK